MPGDALSGEALPGEALPRIALSPNAVPGNAHSATPYPVITAGETNFSQLRGGEIVESFSQLKQCI